MMTFFLFSLLGFFFLGGGPLFVHGKSSTWSNSISRQSSPYCITRHINKNQIPVFYVRILCRQAITEKSYK